MSCLGNTSLCGRDLEGTPAAPASAGYYLRHYRVTTRRRLFIKSRTQNLRVSISLYPSSIVRPNNLPVSCDQLCYDLQSYGPSSKAGWRLPSAACLVTTLLLPPSFPHHAKNYPPGKHDTQIFECVGCTRMQALKSSRQTFSPIIMPLKTVVLAPLLTSCSLPSFFLS
jgi:hypothetical protein